MRRGVVAAAVCAGALTGGAGLAAPASQAAGCATPAYDYEAGGAAGQGFPNDPLFDRQWGLEMIGAPAAWARAARGAGVVIAIVDSGVDLRHPDLSRKLVPGVDIAQGGPGEAADCPPGPQDAFHHGTFAAGIAAADTHNRIGIAGVAPDAQIMPVQFDDLTMHPFFQEMRRDKTVESFRWAADHGADVISFSSTSGERSLDPTFISAYEEAVDYAWDKGTIVVAAAGNNSAPACEQPASATRAVCVAAVDRSGAAPMYSNQPLHLGGGVALRAPGGADEGNAGCAGDERIWSTTLPKSPPACTGAQGYDQRSGTSWAVPHVAGVAALLAGMGLTNEEIVECLRKTSSGNGATTPTMGYGIVDADAATATCGRRGSGPRSPRLRLVVRPRRVRTGRRAKLAFRAVAAGRPVDDAVVRLGRRTARTNAYGRASLTRRFALPGTRKAWVTRSGFRRDSAVIRVRGARRGQHGRGAGGRALTPGAYARGRAARGSRGRR